jgi:hypothetical protein
MSIFLSVTCAYLVSHPLYLRRADAVSQYPWQEKPFKMETVLTSRPDEISRIRARNALKILLDVHGDFGARVAASGKPLSLAKPNLKSFSSSSS